MGPVPLTVSQGNLDNNHLYVTDLLKIAGFLPQDFIAGMGSIEIEGPSLSQTFTTARFHNRFRNRVFPRAFYRFHDVKDGDTVLLEKLEERKFRLTFAGGAAATPEPPTPAPTAPPAVPSLATSAHDDVQAFRLEKHLEEFVAHNWSRIAALKDWELIGVQYSTAIGPIDMLAKHKTRPHTYLVVELKRDQTSDDTIGQICRYMGWVEAHLAGENGTVEGMVIAHEQDDKIRYAVRRVRDVSLLAYAITFALTTIDPK